MEAHEGGIGYSIYNITVALHFFFSFKFIDSKYTRPESIIASASLLYCISQAITFQTTFTELDYLHLGMDHWLILVFQEIKCSLKDTRRQTIYQFLCCLLPRLIILLKIYCALLLISIFLTSALIRVMPFCCRQRSPVRAIFFPMKIGNSLLFFRYSVSSYAVMMNECLPKSDKNTVVKNCFPFFSADFWFAVDFWKAIFYVF